MDKNKVASELGTLFGSLSVIFAVALVFFAWITHIVVAIYAKAWLLLIAGALVPPVGIIHGIASWLGYSWT